MDEWFSVLRAGTSDLELTGMDYETHEDRSHAYDSGKS